MIEIVNLKDIADPGSYGFSYKKKGIVLDGFVVQKDGVVKAYENKCPHTGAPLDWVEHQFLDADKALIQCAVHDARFLIETGECVFGPCLGECLNELKIGIKNQTVFLSD